MKQVIGGINTQLVVVKLYLPPWATMPTDRSEITLNVNVQGPIVLQLIFDWTWNSLSFIENPFLWLVDALILASFIIFPTIFLPN